MVLVLCATTRLQNYLVLFRIDQKTAIGRDVTLYESKTRKGLQKQKLQVELQSWCGEIGSVIRYGSIDVKNFISMQNSRLKIEWIYCVLCWVILISFQTNVGAFQAAVTFNLLLKALKIDFSSLFLNITERHFSTIT